jgi:threonine aldolase
MDAPVDLRSDTVSKPSDAMRRAMASAEVGDDWYGDDPTVNRLQDRAAELTGKEAAAYLATGTLCSQIAMHALVRAGHLVVCEATAHVGGAEEASSAVLSGITFRKVRAASRGLLTARQVTAALEPDPYDATVVDLVTVENTHQVGGGSVLPVGEMRAIAAACADRGVPLYLDGARIFNACVVTGATVGDYAAGATAMMFCLSKGLGAPVGSMLTGTAELMEQARIYRKALGGGMRQAGVLAAAGLIALEQMPARLHEDHANARLLAEALSNMEGVAIDPDTVETNIVIFRLTGAVTAKELTVRLKARGILASTVGADAIRLVTHHDVSRGDCITAAEALSEEIEAPAPLAT